MPVTLTSTQPTKIVKEVIDGQIVDVRRTEGMQGAPALTISLNDPEWVVANSSILDLNENERLDHIDTEVGGEHWRLVQVSPANDTLNLTFENRVVAILRSYKKPRRHRRIVGYTRAMFIQALIEEAVADGHDIRFVCPRLHDAQTIAKGKPPRAPKDSTGVKGFSPADLKGKRKKVRKGRRIPPQIAHNHPGVHSIPPKYVTTYKLTIRGAKPTKAQVKNIETVLGVADRLNAPRRATVALMEACIDESNCTNPVGGDADSGGILQVRRSVHPNVNVMDIEACVTLFLTKGFSGKGGAITLANTTALPPHMIAQDVQGSATADGSNYKQFQDEADAWVNAYHVLPDGSQSDTATYTVDKAYYFGRGYDSSGGTIKGEDSWTAMNRLADEVNWRVFVRGNTVYYIADYELFKQKPVQHFARLDPTMIDTSFDWDEGKLVNELALTVQRQDIPHGSTISIDGVGTADGRWLVWEVEREASGGFSNLTCRTPQAAKKEPAPETDTTTTQGNPTARKTDAFSSLIAAMQSVSNHTKGYTYGGGHGPKLSTLPPSTRFDCSSSCSWVLFKSGMFGKGDTAIVSGEFAKSWGKPGQGKMFTVWANADHVWIQLHGAKWWRFDTSQHPLILHKTGFAGLIDGGACLIKTPRSTAGFTPRHWPGM